jgi:hypothetical protein
MSWQDDTLRQVLEAAGKKGQGRSAPGKAESLVLAAQAILQGRDPAESSIKARQRLNEIEALFTSPAAMAIAAQFGRSDRREP